MKRITVDEVKEAYAKTGLIPVAHDYLWVDSASNWCACGAFAVACLRNPDLLELAKDAYAAEAGERSDGGSTDALVEAELNSELGDAYLVGFIRGFDDCRVGIFPGDPEETDWGYADGKAAREAILIPND